MRIIKSVGMDMVKLETYQGFSADIVGTLSLLTANYLDCLSARSHTKTTAIMGVGAARRISSVNWGVVRDADGMDHDIPGCGLIGFLMAYCL